MKEIVQCVPNISEGRNREIVEAVVDSIRGIPDVKLLDWSSDADHNRSVITFVGTPDGVEKAAFALCSKAAQLIDMTVHSGEHPRMGATDVVPFIPIQGVTMEQAVQLANRVGKRIGEELGIPVYLYENAAKTPARRNLADVRRGQYEGLQAKLARADGQPDYGPAVFNAKSGATAVGARMPLVAFNVNLGTDNLEIANKIARNVRHASGGLKAVKAMGVNLEARGIVQVSMNMVNYKETPLYRVFELIRTEARRYGVSIIGSEIIGLVPLEAMVHSLDYYLGLEGFQINQVLETRLWTDEE
ncbi:MAG TPA: glutamate formimidoyltransferase [Firmicutes bacterium]|nr:glutamate formimidoyltransferase [Bacillota bacterium]HCX78950.1 glutamate formimidoyltransferase [Bacillota bacterium]